MIERLAALSILAFLISPVATGQDDTTTDPVDYVYWNSKHVEETADRLEEILGDKALVWETVGNYDGHSVYLVLRGKTGTAEIHETESDVQISVRGSATSVIGGELIDAEQRPRKQIRGSSIRGGERRELLPGDIMHIPPGLPHQLLIDEAEPYMYLLIKIDEEPLQ
jgi:mannose-6-phosphate isomerase-like protein (cupin superfamily)